MLQVSETQWTLLKTMKSQLNCLISISLNNPSLVYMLDLASFMK
jgi:hypothetical protein